MPAQQLRLFFCGPVSAFFLHASRSKYTLRRDDHPFESFPQLSAEPAHWQYPKQRNLIRRLLEPLGSADLDSKESSETPALAVDNPERGAAIVFDHVTIRALGHTILRPFGRTRTEQ